MLGGQAALLVGLVAFTAWRMTRPRPQPSEPLAHQPDEPDVPAPHRPALGRRQLPVVVRPPCIPRPGHACWRGQVRLSDKVRKVWADERAEQRRAAEAELATHESDSDSAVEAGDLAEALTAEEEPELPLPPDGPWTAHARIHAYLRKGATGAGGATPAQPGDVVAGTLEEDGRFELQVPPGVYDVELYTFDGRLVAFADALPAHAGAAEEGMELVLVPTVAIAGRVVDGDGIGVDADVSVVLAARTMGRMGTPTEDGRFRFDGVRPGTYLVTVTADGATRDETVQAHAPATDVAVSVRWLPEGLVLVAPQADGGCPRGALELRSAAGGRGRRLHFEACQAPAGPVRPGALYRVKGILAGRSYDKEVVFGDAPASPICLDPRCGADAAVRIRVVDLAGTIVDGFTTVEMTESGRGYAERDGTVSITSPGSHFLNGLRSGIGVHLRAIVGAQEGDPVIVGNTTAWLAPGMNQIVVRLPQIVAALPELSVR